jgi:hypothetical protein
VTTVRFTHGGVWDAESVRSHERGWGRAFDNLERTLGCRPRYVQPSRGYPIRLTLPFVGT